MTSILKVDNIQNSSGTAAMAIDGSGNATMTGNTTFTGTVSGSGMDLLYDLTSSSSVSAHDISSTYINSTYDNYYLVGYFEGDADNRYLQGQAFVGGVVQSGSSYYGEAVANIDGANYANTNDSPNLFTASSGGMGREDGEGVNVSMVFQNANSTQAPFCVHGLATQHNASGNHGRYIFSGSAKPANRAVVVNGIRLKMHSGNIEYAKFKLYGMRD